MLNPTLSHCAKSACISVTVRLLAKTRSSGADRSPNRHRCCRWQIRRSSRLPKAPASGGLPRPRMDVAPRVSGGPFRRYGNVALQDRRQIRLRGDHPSGIVRREAPSQVVRRPDADVAIGKFEEGDGPHRPGPCAKASGTLLRPGCGSGRPSTRSAKQDGGGRGREFKPLLRNPRPV